jgi:hypothetical protein
VLPSTTPGAVLPDGKPPAGMLTVLAADADALDVFDCETAPISPGSFWRTELFTLDG